jgi:superfamily II DNA/RNA helicase
MSAATIKRHNHRVLHCNTERKIELINHLLEQHNNLSIVIVSKDAKDESKDIELTQNVIITSDDKFNDDITDDFDMLINLDLPDMTQTYLNRIELAKIYSFIILDPSELTAIYPIEMALGRAFVQEMIKGFETTQSQENKIQLAKQQKKEKRYLKENKEKQEKKEREDLLKKTPPKRNVRKIASKKED